MELLKVVEPSISPVTLLDYGCGYGALVDYLKKTTMDFLYVGYDPVGESIAHAKALHKSSTDCFFTTDISELPMADYCIASGLFNMSFDIDANQWLRHIYRTLAHIAALSRRGFAFNLLSKHNTFSIDGLHYADPSHFGLL